MKRFYSSLFVSAIVAVCAVMSSCSSPSATSGREVSPYPVEQGVSAPFAGFIGDEMMVGGGCNFPDVPAADGGKKVFYSSFFSYAVADELPAWTQHQLVSFPVAYGATVETEEGMVCIGGVNEQSSLSDVFYIQRDADHQKFVVKTLPSLPETIDNAFATRVNQTLYVTGGNQGNKGNSLYALCLEKDSVWTKLADYPGPQRIQPVLLASDKALYLFGGFSVNPETKEAVISSNYLVYQIAEDKWGEAQEIPGMKEGGPRALVGCAGTRVANKLLIAGGVNYAIFKDAVEGKAPKDYMKRPAEWYQFSKDLLVYDLQTSAWSIVSNVEGFNKAGGSLLYHDEYLYMVCGEIKPGIRTSEIKAHPLKELYKDVLN